MPVVSSGGSTPSISSCISSSWATSSSVGSGSDSMNSSYTGHSSQNVSSLERRAVLRRPGPDRIVGVAPCLAGGGCSLLATEQVVVDLVGRLLVPGGLEPLDEGRVPIEDRRPLRFETLWKHHTHLVLQVETSCTSASVGSSSEFVSVSNLCPVGTERRHRIGDGVDHRTAGVFAGGRARRGDQYDHRSHGHGSMHDNHSVQTNL